MIDLKQEMAKRAYSIYDDIYTLIEQTGSETNRKRHSLVFEFYSSDTINGYSKVVGEKDYICISEKCFEMYQKPFSEYENYSIQKLVNMLHLDDGVDDSGEISFEGILNVNGVMQLMDSKEIVKQRARLMTVLAIRHIVLHEMGHIFNGHLEYLNNKNGKSLSLFVFENDNTNDTLMMRTLEMDADAFAATNSIRYIQYLYDNFDRQVSCMGLSKDDLFYYWATAVRMSFLYNEYFTRDPYKPEYYKEMTHLPMSARWVKTFDISTTLVDMANRNNAEFGERIKKKIFDGANEANRVFNDMYCRPDSNWVKDAIDSSEYIEYSDEVDLYWKTILVNELKPFARCPLCY